MESSDILQIIALSWLSNLVVSFYVNRCIKRKLPMRKPFDCEKCLGFYVGIIYFSTQYPLTEESVIFACLTSLSAVLLNGISHRLNS